MRCQFKWGSSFYITLQTDNSDIKFYTYTCNNLLKYMYICLVRNTHLKRCSGSKSNTVSTSEKKTESTIKLRRMQSLDLNL